MTWGHGEGQKEVGFEHSERTDIGKIWEEKWRAL